MRTQHKEFTAALGHKRIMYLRLIFDHDNKKILVRYAGVNKIGKRNGQTLSSLTDYTVEVLKMEKFSTIGSIPKFNIKF